MSNLFNIELIEMLSLGLMVLLFAVLLWRNFQPNKSLGDQLRLAFGSVIAVSLLIIVGTLIWQIQDTLTRQTGQSFLALAKSNKQRLISELEREIGLLDSLSTHSAFSTRIVNTSEVEFGALSPDVRQKRLYEYEAGWLTQGRSDLESKIFVNAASNELNKFRNSFPAHQQLLIIDRYGGLVALAGPRPKHFYYGDEAWWPTVTGTANQDAYINNIKITAGQPETTIDVAFPLHLPNTFSLRGVILSRFLLPSLQLFADIEIPGQTGSMLLLDHDYHIIHSTNPTDIGLKYQANISQQADWQVVPDKQGHDLIQAVVPIDYMALNWKLVIQQNKEEALVTVNRLTQTAVVGGLLTLGLAMFLVTILSRYVSRPLSALTDVASSFAEGDLEKLAPLMGPRETQTLATVFNQMTNQIQEQLLSLKTQMVQLQAMDTLKDEFLANTSHELRTPLNGIIGLAESMVDGATGDLSDVQKQNLAMIVASGQRLSNLVGDILDFSKMRHQDLELQLGQVDLKVVVDIVLSLSRPLVGHKDVRLINTIANDVPLVYGDENRLQQILHNLIDNAIKFTKRGQVEVGIKEPEHSRLDSNALLTITISDTGIGIAKENQARIFQSFEQADGSTAREYGGTGLGLAITKQLVELHGGTIWLESEPNKGSTFYFTLPLSQEAPPNTAALPLSQSLPVTTALETTPIISPTPATPLKGQFTILVVDDEPVNLKVLYNYLSLEPYNLVFADNGFDVLAWLEQGQRFDLIILDVMMPRLSGYEVSRRLREYHTPDQLPVIMLTAKNQTADLVTGFEMGASDYLTKPVNKDELLARIKTLLKLKQAQKERLKLTAIQQELSIAYEIQKNLLPTPCPDWSDIELVCFSTPAKDVGGDFYQYHRLDDKKYHTSLNLSTNEQSWAMPLHKDSIVPNETSLQKDNTIKRYAIAVGDVSGKGVSAALLMATSIAQFDASLLHPLSPTERLTYLDRVISPYTKPRRQNCAMCYVELTIQYEMIPEQARLQPERQSRDPQFFIEIINAGCIPPYIKRGDGSVEFNEELGGFALGQGLGELLEYESHMVELFSGDLVILTSDGVVEANDKSGTMLGFEQLEQIVKDGPTNSAAKMLQYLKQAVLNFTSEAEQHDDLTIVVIRV